MKCKRKPIELGDFLTQEDNSWRKMEDFNNQPVTLESGQTGLWYTIINKETSFGGLQRMSNYLLSGSKNLLHLIWVCWSKISLFLFSKPWGSTDVTCFYFNIHNPFSISSRPYCLQKQSFVKWKLFNDFTVYIW